MSIARSGQMTVNRIADRVTNQVARPMVASAMPADRVGLHAQNLHECRVSRHRTIDRGRMAQSGLGLAGALDSGESRLDTSQTEP